MASAQSGVYALKNAVAGKVYVGSSIDLARRKRTHFRDLNKGVHKSVKLQHSWAKHGAEAFAFEILELTPREERALRAAEQRWIDALDAVSAGYNLNPVAGNVGRMPKSAEHRKRIGDSRRGRVHTAETKAVLSESARLRAHRPCSDETKLRISTAKVGRAMTPEARANLSAARTGLRVGPQSSDHKAAISASKLGKPLSEHHKQRIRDGHAASRAAKASA